jgi:hypothetical protein
MPRKPFGKFFELAILNSLEFTLPRTTEFIRRSIAEKLDKPGLSWHTVNKYLTYLRDSQKIEEIRIGKTTTYKLRK